MIARKVSGFTLVELMVTLAVLAILAGIAFPSFEGVIRSNRVAATTNELLASLSFARMEAIKNAHGAGVCASAGGAACDGAAWGDGWLVWADDNGNGALDAGEQVLRISQSAKKMQGDAEALVIAFDQRGRRRGNDDQAIVLQPTDCGGQPLSRTIDINQSGQVKVVRGACS